MNGVEAGRADQAFALLQLLLPTRLLSTLVHHVMRIRAPWFKNTLIRWFMRSYGVSLNDAERGRVQDYEHFNDFFTRALQPGVRPLDPEPTRLISPVDGVISELGRLDGDRLIQAKGLSYRSADLLGDADDATAFHGGHFCTIYLAPHNYHRIHMPLGARLRHWRYVPGRLFSVNPATVRAMPRLFARNERLCALFDSNRGPFALVMVGALFVGSLETVWAGQVTPPHARQGETYTPIYPTPLVRGAEMGRFNMGSTVILLAGPGMLEWLPGMAPLRPLRMGEGLATLR
jgi:phosphatidylserine decarboxylase